MPKVFDFECIECTYIFEKIIFDDDEEILCPLCYSEVKKLISAPRIANYKSGFKRTPLLKEDGEELNTKKEDIFGRRFEDLPDDLELESKYHEDIWKKRQQGLTTPVLDDQFESLYRIYGEKRLKEKGVIKEK